MPEGIESLPVQQRRRFGWKPDKPDIRDKAFLPTAIKLPTPRFFFSPRIMPPRGDQGDLGSCTGWAVRGPIRLIKNRKGNEQDVELSPLFAYYNARVIENSVEEDAGAEIRDVVKGVHKLGIATDADWPYDIGKFADKPSATAYTNATQDLVKQYRRLPFYRDGISLRALKEACVRHQPVTFGFSVYESFDDDSVYHLGLMPMPRKRRDQIIGGHAIWLAGYDNTINVLGQKGALLLVNSWGEEWGCAHPEESAGGDARTARRGYFWMPMAYATNGNLCDDAWALKVVA